MRAIGTAVILLALASGPVLAQSGGHSPAKGSGTNEVMQKQEEQEQRERKDVDKQYNETVKHTRGQAVPYDPWHNARSTNPPSGGK